MKRKLKDLKENECIKVNTLAQAKYFIEKKFPNSKENEIVGNYIHNSSGFFWSHEHADKNILPASDFIKPKKSGMVKRLEAAIKACEQLAETQEKTNEYLEVLNGKNERIENTEQLTDSSKTEHTELKEGKWYKSTEISSLCFRRGNRDNYGFLFDKWSTDIVCATPTEWIEATREEVEEALIKEAKRRGFKEGVNFISAQFSGEKLANKDVFNLDADFFSGYQSMYFDGNSIFYYGKWAEIIHETEDIYWSKPGQLVVACDGEGEGIVITEGFYNKEEGSFSGTVVVADNVSKVGEYFKEWDIKDFKPYIGTITLKND